MPLNDFTSMPVWQKALALLVRIYKITQKFPVEEKFGMTSDMRRAANSVLHNLAEGYGRFENRDKTRFYKISRGSAYELISQTIASFVLEYLDEKEKIELVEGYKEIITEQDLLIKSIELRRNSLLG